MVWYAWLLVTLYAVQAIGTVSMVGRRRTPITAGQAAVSVAITPLFIWAIVALAS